MGSFSYTSRVLSLFLCRQFLLHIACWLLFYVESFSCISRAGFFFFFFLIGGFSSNPVLASHFYLGSFSYTSRANFIFIWEVSLTHPVPALILSRNFTGTLPAAFIFIRGVSLSYTSRAGFIFIQGISLTHPVLPSFLCGEFLLHIPSCLHFYVRSFPYTSDAGSFLCGEFLFHIPS